MSLSSENDHENREILPSIIHPNRVISHEKKTRKNTLDHSIIKHTYCTNNQLSTSDLDLTMREKKLQSIFWKNWKNNTAGGSSTLLVEVLLPFAILFLATFFTYLLRWKLGHKKSPELIEQIWKTIHFARCIPV